MKELKEARKELKEAKQIFESNGYQRKLVYKLTYLKDNIWKNIYFDDEEDAHIMIAKMHEINTQTPIYSYISLNKWSWEMFIEP